MAVSDPGAPTAKEIATHNLTHLPHRASKESEVHAVPEFCFDWAFLGSKGEEATQAIQVGRDRRIGMLFAHHVPRKGRVSAHGAAEMLKDLDRLRYGRVLLKCDNEPALVSVQKEVVRLRAKDTGGRARGQVIREQMRAIRAGLQDRLQVRIPGTHALTSWMVEHAAIRSGRRRPNGLQKTERQRVSWSSC